jgi:O-acetyl-ADP-ribose deacetylase
MKKVRFNGISVELIIGDIVEQVDCDAIVNAANTELRTGGGVAGAIHSVGDPELENETRLLAPIKPGEAVLTSAPNLPNKHIIHCLGPVYGKDNPSDLLLRKCYDNALKLAEENGIESIAFPAISTGTFGYPMREAATIGFQSIKDNAGKLDVVSFVRFVLWSATDYNLHWDVLKEM